MSIKQGLIGESVFITECLKRNFEIYSPIVDTGVDFLINVKGRYKKIQVKCTAKPDTRYPTKPSYKINIRRGFDNRAYDKGEFDFFCIYLMDINTWYVVPLKDVESKTTIRINDRSDKGIYAKYRNAFHLLK